MKEYLIPEGYIDQETVPTYEAQMSYELVCQILINQFNKLREAYKEAFMYIRKCKYVTPDIPQVLKHKRSIKDNLFHHKDNKKYKNDIDLYDYSSEESFAADSSDDDFLSFEKASDSRTKPSSNGTGSFGSRKVVPSSDDDIPLNKKFTDMLGKFKNTLASIFSTADNLLENVDIKQAVKTIEKEKIRASKDLIKAWNAYAEILKFNPTLMKRHHEAKYNRLFGKMVAKRTVCKRVNHLKGMLTDKNIESREKKANAIRERYFKYRSFETARGLPSVKDQFAAKYSPIFFEEKWQLSETRMNFKSTCFNVTEADDHHSENGGIPYHVIFIVHGFRGKHNDMNKIWNNIMLRFPKCKPYLCSSLESLANNTDHDIVSMGKVLAIEITQEIVRVSKPGRDVKISFIGHSLGGLLIRCAITHLARYRDHFNALITLATPHCGYMHSSSKLLSAGIWVYDKITNNPVLNQIRCADAPDIRDTVIYQLSLSESISWFKEILFVGCNQDTLAPLETAVIQTSERMSNQKGYKGVRDMQRNIL